MTKKFTLLNHIIPVKNADKEFQEEATEDLFLCHTVAESSFMGLHRVEKQHVFSTPFYIKILIELLWYTTIVIRKRMRILIVNILEKYQIQMMNNYT